MSIAEKKILSKLKNSDVEYEVFEHEPVYTCEQAAEVRGITPQEGIKCLLLNSGEGRVLAITRGDKKVDLKKLASLEGVKKLKLANDKEVQKIAKCKIGCVHPFCKRAHIYFDQSLLENEFIEFNPGCHDKSVRIKVKDLWKLLKEEYSPKLESISLLK